MNVQIIHIRRAQFQKVAFILIKFILGKGMKAEVDSVTSLESISSNATTFPEGTQLIAENDTSRNLFIILKGRVRVYKTYLGQKVTLAVLGAGEIFGELSFIDAQPRSASVETLTEVAALIIGGDTAEKQIAQLPEWVLPIFKIIFHRFRENANRLAILENMKDFRRRAINNVKVDKVIYQELFRFLQTLKRVYENRTAKEGSQGGRPGVRIDHFYQDLDEKLKGRGFSLSSLWQQLEKHGLIDRELLNKHSRIILKLDLLDEFTAYLAEGIKDENFLILNDIFHGVLAKVLELAGTQSGKVKLGELFPGVIGPKRRHALRELKKIKTIKMSEKLIEVDPLALSRVFIFQSFLKEFDYRTITTT